jgi:hypothetical protein
MTVMAKATKESETKATPKPERKTVASEARRLILAGKTNEEVVKALKLPESKRHYVAWYRAQLIRREREANGAKAADALRAALAATARAK